MTIDYDQLKKLQTRDYMSMQNSQMARIFRLSDPLVEIIIITPFDLQLDILAYYVKMLEINGIPDAETRIHFVTPVIFCEP